MLQPRSHHHALLFLALLLLLLPHTLSTDPDPALSRARQAVSGAVQTLSKSLTPPLAALSETSNGGREALDAARAAASGPSSQEQTQNSDDTHELGRDTADTASANEDHVGPVSVECGPMCHELGDALLATVEGGSCRALFINGKCPTACSTSISEVTQNSSWTGCASTCEGDVVNGAAERWASLCESRQETLIDQGKEAMKSLVSDGLTTRLHKRAVLQFFVGVLILVVGLGLGYRRGSMGYRLPKRLLSRKCSDQQLPI